MRVRDATGNRDIHLFSPDTARSSGHGIVSTFLHCAANLLLILPDFVSATPHPVRRRIAAPLHTLVLRQQKQTNRYICIVAPLLSQASSRDRPREP